MYFNKVIPTIARNFNIGETGLFPLKLEGDPLTLSIACKDTT